ncbi:hypothetical protein GCK32_012122 [Trichostrongylus colubriformis]|uniref:Peptidase S1 domain-containing protein n=1 Tax=Trichostrongylus colubriformis TaxID=6319 RepID=A0AAN8F426_TRICO
MQFVLAFLFVLQCTYGMKDAEETEWNRYGYLVKILSQSPLNDSRVIGCTGTLIAPSLILTSSKCIATDDDGETGNTIVIYSKGTTHRKRAVSSITQIDRIAVLEIIAIRDEMCPPPPAPPKLSKLAMNVTLTSVPWQPVDLEMLPEKKCRINGFKTTEVSDFATEHETMQSEVQVVRDDGGIVVEVQEGTPVCWDDIGLPLECMLDDETWTQVGFLESVSRAMEDEQEEVEEEEEERAETTRSHMCDNISNMRFLMFDSDELAKMLDQHAIDVLLATRKCFLRDYPSFGMIH